MLSRATGRFAVNSARRKKQDGIFILKMIELLVERGWYSAKIQKCNLKIAKIQKCNLKIAKIKFGQKSNLRP